VTNPVLTSNVAANNYGYTTSNVNVGSNAYGNYGYVSPAKTVNFNTTSTAYQPITTAPTKVSTVQNVTTINSVD
jgi:hypothetical protein